jgi:hypothetical protein
MSARTIIASVGALAALGAAAVGVGAVTDLTSKKAAQDPVASADIRGGMTAAAAISRSQVISRALTWNPHTAQRIPYSQSATHNGYRTDCSGYASMALGLGTPGLNTVGLASSSTSSPIAMSQLLTGDLVIDATGDNNTRHVVIFEKWADSAHSSYWAFEQRGSYGTDHRVLTYGIGGGEFHAYRPHVLGGGGTPPPPPSGGKHWVKTFSAATGYAGANTASPQGVLNQGTNYVYCKVWGARVGTSSQFNHWWLKTDLDRTYAGKNGRGAYVSAYYLSRWGNDEAKDVNGAVLPNC